MVVTKNIQPQSERVTYDDDLVIPVFDERAGATRQEQAKSITGNELASGVAQNIAGGGLVDPDNGTAGQVLARRSSARGDVEWTDQSGGLSEAEVDARVQAGVEDWAEEGNTDAIPASKLTNAPSGGLDQAAVDARVAAGVEDWAEAGDSNSIPTAKLANALTATGIPAPEDGSEGQILKINADGNWGIGDDLVGQAGSGEANPPAATQQEADAGTGTALRSWSPLRVRQAVLGFINLDANQPFGNAVGRLGRLLPTPDGTNGGKVYALTASGNGYEFVDLATGNSGGAHIYLGTGSVSDDSSRVLTLDGTTDPSDGDIVVFMMGSANLPTSNAGDVGSVAHNGNTYTIVRTAGNGLHTNSLDRNSVYIGRLDGTVIRLPGDVNIPILATEAQATGGTHAFGRIYSAALIRAAIDARVPQSRTLPNPGSGNSGKIVKINDSNEWALADDISGAGGTSDYDDLTDKPIVRVASVAGIPDPALANVGTRYQDTSTGRQYVSVGIPQHGTDRVVNLTQVSTVAGNAAGYRGAVGVYYDLPNPSSLPHGAFYLVRYDAYHSTTAFRQVTSQGGWERVATWPGSGTYRGAFLNQEEAEANVEAAGDIVVLGTTEANSQVYSVDSDFVAGTPASTEYELRAVDAFHVSDADDPLVASDVRDWALESSGDLVPRNRLSLGSMSESEARAGTAANERIVSALRLAQAAKGAIDRDAGIAQAVQDIQSLTVLTEDLQVETQKAWVTVPNATGAAMHVGALGSNPPTTATAAAALSYVATFDIPTTYHDGSTGSSLTPIVIRIPLADDQNDYRLVQVHNGESRSISHFWLSIGSDATYHYYYSSPILFSGYQLRFQNNTNAVVGTEYHGDVSHATGLPAAVPSGGTDGQLLSRDGTSGLDWVDSPAGLPTGGSDGQILAKSADTNFATEWIDAPTGGGSAGTAENPGHLVQLHNEGQPPDPQRSNHTWYTFDVAQALTEADDNKVVLFTFHNQTHGSQVQQWVHARTLRLLTAVATSLNNTTNTIRFRFSELDHTGLSDVGSTSVYIRRHSGTQWGILINNTDQVEWFSVDLITAASIGATGAAQSSVTQHREALYSDTTTPNSGAGYAMDVATDFVVSRALTEADDNKFLEFIFLNATLDQYAEEWISVARFRNLDLNPSNSSQDSVSFVIRRPSDSFSSTNELVVTVRKKTATTWAVSFDSSQIHRITVNLVTLMAAGSSGGRSETQVNAQIDTRVDDWARTNATTEIPTSAIDADAPSQTEAEAGTAQTSRFWTAERVNQAIKAAVADWAETGNTGRIPEAKLPAPEVVYEDTSDVDSPAYNHVGWTPFQLSRALTSGDDHKTLRFSFRGRNESTNRRFSEFFYVSAKTFRELPEHSTNPSSRQDTLYMTVPRLYEDGLSSFGVCRVIFSHVVGGRNYRLSISHANAFFRMKIELIP